MNTVPDFVTEQIGWVDAARQRLAEDFVHLLANMDQMKATLNAFWQPVNRDQAIGAAVVASILLDALTERALEDPTVMDDPHAIAMTNLAMTVIAEMTDTGLLSNEDPMSE